MTLKRLAAGAAIAFGLLTLISGFSVLMGLAQPEAVVPFVLWFNTLAGAAYVLGGILLWRGHRLALTVALAILIATLLVFAAFGLHAVFGGNWSIRTLAAMALRSGFWAGMVALAATPRRR